MSEVKDLVSLLNVARNAYYNEDTPIMSDKEYDELFDKLVELEGKTGIVLANSPTQTVGYTVVGKLKEVTHNHPLLSLGKTTDADEFFDYFEGKDICLMQKMDGLTCSLAYENGELVSAETRGNGFVGEDILHNARTFINLPLKIPYKGKLIVDGECIISNETFKKINDPLVKAASNEAKELGLDEVETADYVHKHSYANARNLAAGTVRQLDSSVCASREVRFIAWRVYEGPATDSYKNAFEWLIIQGFEVVPYLILRGTNKDRFLQAINYLKIGPYPFDGLVGSFDDIAYGNTKGVTLHHFKHSLAFKFYQESVETTLLDIEWNVTRSGSVNPVAVFEPVNIDGTNVTRATLNNVSFIKDLKLGIGDTITVKKANQIIPQICENLTEKDDYVLPCNCPVCGKKLVIRADNDSEVLYCTNPDCKGKFLDKLSHFVSREGMDIEGLSVMSLKTFAEAGYINSFADLFKLSSHKDEIAETDGFGTKSVEKLLNEIEIKRTVQLSNLLYALGIPGIGKATAKDVAKHLAALEPDDNIFCFHRLAKEGYDWSVIDGIGKLTSDGINRYLSSNDFSDLFSELTVVFPEIIKASSDNAVAGKTFCITGKLESFPNRDALVADIEAKGGKVVSSVSIKTNYLITNDPNSGSSKNKKAKVCGTVIITEKEYCML